MALPAQTPWSEIVRKFRALGYEGPVYTGHPFMVRGKHRQRIPNSHDDPVPIGKLRDVLRKAGIDDDTWNRL
jgi:hypothetical protein